MSAAGRGPTGSRCAGVQSALRAFVDGELGLEESRAVVDHLQHCPTCRDREVRVRLVASTVQSLPPVDPPPHFAAALQVRLARRRRPASLFARLRSLGCTPGRPRRWAGGLATAAGIALAALVLTPRLGAAEVAERAGRTWLAIRNYACTFESRGIYQGQPRAFQQRQFYQRPGSFRLETRQDYPLVSYVWEDRVLHYLPGGTWRGRGPLVIVRPRSGNRDELPFPFGVAWQHGDNISLDQLIRRLGEGSGVELVGREEVSGRTCHHLRLPGPPATSSTLDRYELWIDAETFLPRRVSWYRDAQNAMVTEALDMQVNGVLPEDTFEFQAPEGSVTIRGDVDPHVLALPRSGAPAGQALHSEPGFTADPVGSARLEAWARRRDVPFTVHMPAWLPDGFELLRVRRQLGRWVDAYWIRPGPDGRAGDVLKLVERHSAGPLPPEPGARRVELGTRRNPLTGYLQARLRPYPYVSIAWERMGTLCELSAANVDEGDLLRIARSMAPLASAPAGWRAAVGSTGESAPARDPSVLPSPLSVAAERAGPAEAEPRYSGPQVGGNTAPPILPGSAEADLPATTAVR